MMKIIEGLYAQIGFFNVQINNTIYKRFDTDRVIINVSRKF